MWNGIVLLKLRIVVLKSNVVHVNIYIYILNISHTHILDSVWKHATVLASSSQQERTDRQPEEFRPWLSD